MKWKIGIYCQLFILFSYSLSAQHAHIQSGVILGVDYIGSHFLNEPIRQYNSTRANSNIESLLRRGANYGIYGIISVLNSWQISPEFSISNINSKVISSNNVLEVKYTASHIRLNVNHYLLKELKFLQPNYLSENLFARYTLSYSDFSLKILENGQRLTTKSGHLVDSRSTNFGLGLGLGYDIFLSEFVSITPILGTIWYPRLSFHHYSDIITQNDIPDEGGGNIWNFQLSFRLAYTIIPTIRLCPIHECKVRLHHKHRGLKDIIYRGNFLHKPQNTRIGEKYRRKILKFKKRNGRKIKTPSSTSEEINE